jgi:hypothetical protein
MATPTLNSAGGDLFAAGYAGQIADAEPVQSDSFINSNATTIDFGIVVARDTTQGRACRPVAADGDELLGISIRDPIVQAVDPTNVVLGYKQYDSVRVLRDGVIYVQAAETVRAGDQALMLTAGGSGNSQAGAIGGSAGGPAGAGRIDIPGAIWEDATASGAIGRVRIKTVGTRRTTS